MLEVSNWRVTKPIDTELQTWTETGVWSTGMHTRTRLLIVLQSFDRDYLPYNSAVRSLTGGGAVNILRMRGFPEA